MAPEFRDRSLRLALFGAIAALVGCGLIALGLLQLLVLVLPESLLPAASMRADARTVASGVATYGLIGAAFVWIGIGSLRRKRWSPPLMRVLAWSWLISGALGLLLAPTMIGVALESAALQGTPLPAGFAVGVKATILAGGALLGVFLPLVFVRVFADADVQRTCETHDPNPAWTERCPTSVLGLSVGLGFGGVLLLVLALRPAVPWFGRTLTGWPGGLLLLAGAAMSAWVARSVYRQELVGWWATTALLGLTGMSAWLTVRREGLAGSYRAMGYTRDQIELLGLGGSAATGAALWGTALFTALTLIYMFGVRKHFSGTARASAE